MLRLLINLDRSPDRYKATLKQLTVPFERISAVDGKALSEEEIKQITLPHNQRKIWSRNLSRGEIGCFLSHRKCWKALLESQENWAIILEDDCEISPEFANFINRENWTSSGVHLLKISSLKREQHEILISRQYNVDSNYSIVKVIKPHPVGTQCYAIDRYMASVLLKLTKKIESPVDEYLFSRWYGFGRKYGGFVLSPYLVRPNEHENSFIGDNFSRRNEGSRTVGQFLRWFVQRMKTSIYRKFVGKKKLIKYKN